MNGWMRMKMRMDEGRMRKKRMKRRMGEWETKGRRD